jgi:hypothetical protein
MVYILNHSRPFFILIFILDLDTIDNWYWYRLYFLFKSLLFGQERRKRKQRVWFSFGSSTRITSQELQMKNSRLAGTVAAMIVALLAAPIAAFAQPPVTKVTHLNSTRAFATFMSQPPCHTVRSDVSVFMIKGRITTTTEGAAPVVERTNDSIVQVRLNVYNTCTNVQVVSAWGNGALDPSSQLSFKGGHITGLIQVTDAMDGNKQRPLTLDLTWSPTSEYMDGNKLQSYNYTQTSRTDTKSSQDTRSMRAEGSVADSSWQYGGADESTPVIQEDAKGTTVSVAP